jgi:hypothetical protein
MPELSTGDFPQADKLEQVGLVAIAVSKGHTTDAAIERFIGLNSRSRQGRYYRKAAEVLGLVRNSYNECSLTPTGAAFVQLRTDVERRDFLAKCLTDTELFREVTRFITTSEPSPSKVSEFIQELYPGSATTAARRASTVTAYLLEAGLAKLQAGKYVPGKLASGSLIEHEPDGKGLFGRPVPDDPVTGEPLVTKPAYKVEVDAAKTERANLIHHKLVVAKAAFLRARKMPANQNSSVDLYSRRNGETVLYEMKSLSGANFIPQVRKAVSQLYEYRFTFGVGTARLCVVTNRYPADRSRWYLDYLEGDRGIAYVWTDDFSTFQSGKASSRLLGPFWP